MLPPNGILTTWGKFCDFPMETLTKAWFYQKSSRRKQRSVSLMKEHREQYGISGNCFDLAIWLLDEFEKDGIEAYPIGNYLNTEKAHTAVVALDERGRRFLCDLGDQWLKPILIDSAQHDFTGEILSGFFPAAQVQIKPVSSSVEVIYYRPSGKLSRQVYHTEPLDLKLFMEAAEYSQNQIRPRPLLEVRTPYKSEIAHWEFCNWESYLSTSEGLFKEEQLLTIEEWVERIHSKTRYDRKFLFEALEFYQMSYRRG
ncbi:hypothetical protein ACFFHH_04300 [Cytobacillus solani]|uniref:Uncharacterized protein n=1 Tax=Cytobacillus solani TaxID=1637975 RepID=A0A0Q3QK35_9BACI|nr:hypothetical protein [Cytobacillus solani]KOP71135.1 hypothetical protein AMS60_24105 [Bacillus sp. FJAT-21945]KQL17920.1 hypothetical protein AN957_04385 [Cytobacillus solani]USK55741.1 hypothetical protein LIS82_04210 [Cytobacillus solani]